MKLDTKINSLHKSLFLMIFLGSLIANHAVWAMPSTILVGEQVLPATSGNTFTRINFPSEFAAGTTPNVFPMTTEDGDDPCNIRIRNVDHTGFDAVCFEPANEDGDHPGLMLEYIAIADGTTSVPVSGGGNAVFRSECVSTTTQYYESPCNNCSGPAGFDTITFTPGFSAAPAVLTQIQTTNNSAGGAPVFVGTATRNVNANNFQLSIDRLEVGPGPLTVPEEVCYLAVERNGCQELDLSSLGGPSTPIPFAAVHGDNVDGHGNGCSSGEGAAFPAGCFSSAPIAVASSRSRIGNNGHVLRRCSVNASEIILTADEDRVRDAERNHIDEQVSALAFGSTFTTPVTLSQASVTRFGKKLLFEWQTSAESFHLGFHLWGQVNDEWVQLNRRLIAGNGEAFDGIRDYRHRLRLSNKTEAVELFGISTVDSAGYEEFYGPFSLDQEYGEPAINQPIDWRSVRAAIHQEMTAAGMVEINGRWRAASPALVQKLNKRQYADNKTVLNVASLETGVQKLSGGEILQAVPQWRGQRLDRIAITLNGAAQHRHILSADRYLSEDDEIYFVVQRPRGEAKIYQRHLNYQIRLDASRALPAQRFDARPSGDPGDASSLGMATQTLTTLNAYSAVLDNGDPWYDEELFTTGNPVSKTYNFELTPETRQEQGAKLMLTLFGSLDFPGETPDHHVQVRVNNELIGDIRFDGVQELKRTLVVSGSALVPGENVVTITLPADTGYAADVVLVDELSVQTRYELTAEGASTFRISDSNGIVQIENIDDEHPIFAWREDGSLMLMQNAQQFGKSLAFNPLPHNDSVNYSVHLGHSWVPAYPGYTSAASLFHELEADLLVVAHAALATEKLNEYLTYKRSTGLKVELVDWLHLVTTYGYGNDTPEALDRFLQLQKAYVEANQLTPLDSLLIVGGHTWDYIGLSNNQTLNFIPTHYRPVGLFGHAPTDNVFADLNGDALPELSVGRWPARSKTDLAAIIDKSLAWSEKVAGEQYQDSVLITQNPDGRGLDFDQQMQGRVRLPLTQTGVSDELTLVSMQSIIEQGVDEPVDHARNLISTAINQGADLVSFAGHASTSAWGFQGIVNTEFIQSLDNHGDPVVVMPLACYTTYYESPSINTLAHQWLFAGTQGAVAVHGASVLGEYRENAVFAKRYIEASHSNKTIGGAIRAAKQQLSSDNAMLHNWTLLADPTLPLH